MFIFILIATIIGGITNRFKDNNTKEKDDPTVMTTIEFERAIDNHMRDDWAKKNPTSIASLVKKQESLRNLRDSIYTTSA